VDDRHKDRPAGLDDAGRTAGGGRGVSRRARFLILIGTAVVCLALVALLVV
jgi:hypothetical protein